VQNLPSTLCGRSSIPRVACPDPLGGHGADIVGITGEKRRVRVALKQLVCRWHPYRAEPDNGAVLLAGVSPSL